MQTTEINPPETHFHPSRAEWEKLLSRVLESTPFRRSTRLRDFLIYVGNEVVLRGAEDLHEQQIGMAVFGRSDSYDTSQDNIVRVNAMELRKRIDLYFSNEGKDEPLVFEIPRGSYVPVFHLRSQTFLESPSNNAAVVQDMFELAMPVDGKDPPLPVTTSEIRTQAFRSKLLIFMTVLVVGLSIGLIREVRLNRQAQVTLHKWQNGPALRSFWGNFFGQRLAPEIVLADTSFGIAQDILRRPLSLGTYLDYTYRSMQSPEPLSTEARQQQQSDLAVIFERSSGSIGDFRAARRITELETGEFGTRLEFAREYAGHRLRWSNTIFIGSQRSNPWVELFENQLAYHYRESRDSKPFAVIVDNPAGNEQAEYPLSSNSGPTTGYCLIVFLPNPTNTGNTLIVSGTDSQATEAGGDFLASEEGLEKILEAMHQKTFPYFQILLRISRSNGTPLGSQIVSYRIIKK